MRPYVRAVARDHVPSVRPRPSRGRELRNVPRHAKGQPVLNHSRIAAIGAASLLMAGGLFLVGCGGDSASSSTSGAPADVPADAAYIEVTGKSGAAAVTAAVGSPLVVKLACNGGTGYTWKVKASGDSVTRLKTSTECEPDDSTTSAVGAAGHETHVYDVTTAGTQRLEFLSIPPGATTPASTETVTVVAS